MILAHNKPILPVIWFDYLDFQIRFMLNKFPVIYLGSPAEDHCAAGDSFD